VLEQGRCEPSELVAGEIVWEVVEGVLGVDRVPVDDPLTGLRARSLRKAGASAATAETTAFASRRLTKSTDRP
jgi:hypothetical protein